MSWAVGDRGAWTRRNWFVPLAALLLVVETAFAQSTDWSARGPEEAVILFDLCLFVPALYAFAYRRWLPIRALALRTAALIFLGFYIASHLVPAEAQRLIAELGWARTLGLAVLALIELKLMVEIVKLLFGGGADVETIAARSGAPTWVARLMLAEARFWKWLWRRISGR